MSVAEGAQAKAAASKSPEGRQKWQVHVARAKRFSGSNAEYCRRNGLDPMLFRYYKKKCSGARRPGRAKGFVKVVQRAGKLKESEGSRPPQSHVAAMPDARWTAEFVAALLGFGR